MKPWYSRERIPSLSKCLARRNFRHLIRLIAQDLLPELIPIAREFLVPPWVIRLDGRSQVYLKSPEIQPVEELVNHAHLLIIG